MSSISQADVTKIANLAKLTIDAKQVTHYQNQLSEIIDYFQILDQIELTSIPITSQVTGLENITREKDEIGTRTMTQEQSIDQASNTYNNYVQVPNILTNRDQD